MCGGAMSETVLPTWADIISIGTAALSAAYSWGVIGQKVKGLEERLDERSDRADDLEREFREITNRLSGLEANMTSALSLLAEVRSAVMFKSGGH